MLGTRRVLRTAQLRATRAGGVGDNIVRHTRYIDYFEVYIYITVYKRVCFGRLHAFLRRPWVFPRALSCRAHKGPACTPRRKFGSRAGSVSRALGVRSREIWQVIAESLSAELEPEQNNGKIHIFFRIFFALSSQGLLSHFPSSA